MSVLRELFYGRLTPGEGMPSGERYERARKRFARREALLLHGLTARQWECYDRLETARFWMQEEECVHDFIYAVRLGFQLAMEVLPERGEAGER